MGSDTLAFGGLALGLGGLQGLPSDDRLDFDVPAGGSRARGIYLQSKVNCDNFTYLGTS